MNFILKDILTTYSLPTIIISAIICVVSLTLNKFFSKLPKLLKAYLPFLTAIILYFAYDMVFVVKDFVFREETLYAGIFSGSLGTIICSIIKKFSQGKLTTVDNTLLLIESILEGYIDQNIISSTALEIQALLFLNAGDEGFSEKQVIDAITKASTDISYIDICYLAKLIIAAVKSVKKT